MDNSGQTPHLPQERKVKTSIALTEETLKMLDTLRERKMAPFMSQSEAIDKVLKSYIPIYNEIVEGSTIQIIKPDGSVQEVSLEIPLD
ncbi:MAG: iron-containing alcohol dehydrogenase [Okeania sp. SIO2D1]|nr:iron-containing alcohol dehydrogenase [Okeania sp. SIO2D1]